MRTWKTIRCVLDGKSLKTIRNECTVVGAKKTACDWRLLELVGSAAFVDLKNRRTTILDGAVLAREDTCDFQPLASVVIKRKLGIEHIWRRRTLASRQQLCYVAACRCAYAKEIQNHEWLPHLGLSCATHDSFIIASSNKVAIADTVDRNPYVRHASDTMIRWGLRICFSCYNYYRKANI